MDCLAALPVEQREAIVLKIWHRLTFEEIGGLLGISPNTAAGRYRYGLQKIKNQLAVGRDTPCAPLAKFAACRGLPALPKKGIVYGRERNEITGEPVAFLASAPGVGDA